MSKKLIDLVLTSAVVLAGDIKVKGQTISLPPKEAKNFLQRGKAKLAEGAEVELDEPVALDDMTVPELKKLADDAGIEGFADMKKAELIAAIEAATDPVQE